MLSSGPHEKDLRGGSPETTNNQMELTAAIEGLKALNRRCRVDIWTDSRYVCDGITKWVHNWVKRQWKKADKSPVQNAELWKALLEQTKKHEITWHWVKGHAGNPGNERADELANLSMDELMNTSDKTAD